MYTKHFLNTARSRVAASLITLFSVLAAVAAFAQTNEPPQITGQVALSTAQDTPIDILFDHLTVFDPDDSYPDGFTLFLADGPNYTQSGTTVTPAPGFSGVLTVPVTVNDGEASSEPFNLSIEVVAAPPANIAPVITGQASLTTIEGQPIMINFSDLIVDDPDDPYPSGFSMTLQPGANYTVSGQEVTPGNGFTGTLNVPVTVNDGEDESVPFDLNITVNAQPPSNIAPTITGQTALSSEEDTPITIQFAHLIVNDPDDVYPNGFSMTLSDGPNYSVSGQTITPDNTFSGVLNVPVVVNDGEDDSAPFTLQITVNTSEPANVKPVITGQSQLTTEEGKSIKIKFSDLIVTDPDDPYPNGFTLILGDGPNYSVHGNDIRPDDGFSGTLTVPVAVNDGKETSDTFNLIITVTPKPPKNVAPVITGQTPISMLNSESLTIIFNHLIVTDPDDAYPTGFTLRVFQGDDYTTNGNLIRPDAGFTGTLTVGVAVNDGTAESNRFDLRITVTAPVANAKPAIIGQQELTTFRNTPITLRLTHLIVSDTDDPYPGSFRMEVMTGSNYTVSGTVITPVSGYVGGLSVGVRVNDGTDWSERFNILISVVEKDELRITGQDEITIAEDSVLTLSLDYLEVNDPSGSYPLGFSLVIMEGNNYSVNGSNVTPVADYAGTLEVPVQVRKGVSLSNTFGMIILVTPVNDPPQFLAFNTDAISYSEGNGPVNLAGESLIEDPDDDELVYAEVFIDQEQFSPGKETLSARSTEKIRGVFDPNTGVLVMLGMATLLEYQEVIRSVEYTFSSDTLPEVKSKRVHFRLNDGQDFSSLYTRSVELGDGIKLDIPNVFSPNEDHANDKWVISQQRLSDNASVTVRVFNKRGGMVYESFSIEDGWDGRYRGEILPSDTYFYTIEIRSKANSLVTKGVVTILR